LAKRVRIPQRPLLEFKQKQNLANLIDLQGFDVFGLVRFYSSAHGSHYRI